MPVNVNEIEPDEKIVEIEMERLREFRNHPFKVKADAQMLQLIESISKYGILNPLIVRPLPEGVYEIIAGHRRKYAAQHLGFRKMPVIIRVLRDDDAVINIVDSNLFRESIRHSEKAFAYKMKYEAIKRKSGRKNGDQIDYYLLGRRTIDIIGEDSGESAKQVQRFMKLTELIPELQEMLDEGAIAFNPAYEIAFLTEDGKTEMFTDEKGYAVSIPIPYGKYIVRETTTPHNFTPVDDFKVTISENHPKEPQQWRVLLDDEFEAKLKIIKKDDETKKPVLLPKTEFKVYDMDHKKYVEQVTTYPSTVTHKSYFTDENGYLILPNNLKIGRYRIEEVTAPNGYVLNHNAFEVLVDSNTAYQIDQTSGDAIIEVAMENQPVKGKLTIKKAGEVLASFDKDFGYEMTSLADAEFAVYAAEDIYTPDWQRDENGNRIVIHAKDALVTTVKTDENGLAAFTLNLPLGQYYVKEHKAPAGDFFRCRCLKSLKNREVRGIVVLVSGI